MLNSVERNCAKQMVNKRFLKIPISFNLTVIKEIAVLIHGEERKLCEKFKEHSKDS